MMMPPQKITADRAALLALILLAMLPLSACITRMTAPAPVNDYGLRGGAGSAGMHTAQAGETLWDLSRRYNLSIQDIIAVNGLIPPYALRPGQRLKMPPPQTYRTKAGDTIYAVSRTFGVSQSQLARLNNLRPPYNLNPGQTLRLPTPESGPRQVVTQAARQMAQAMPPAANPAPVEREELSAPTNIVPPPSAVVTVNTLQPPPPKPSPRAQAAGTAKIPPRAGAKFLWPVEGKVISSYGSKSGGLHNDGINIKTAQGMPVRAAENGVVVYASGDLKGYGNMILVRHADRWVTAYAHLDRILVGRGVEVRRGETIGAVGASGGVESPQLHFEIRRGTEALNPEPYLARR